MQVLRYLSKEGRCPNLQDVLCGISVPIMNGTAMRTRPFPDAQIFCFRILIAADMAGLRACIVPINPLDTRSCFARLIFENFHKLRKAVVRDLSAPSFLHSPQVQVLNAHKSVFLADRMCQLEMKVFALIGCLLV